MTCTTGVPSNVMLHIDGKSFPMTDAGNNQYTVTLTIPDDLPSTSGPFDISVSYVCEGQTIIIVVGKWRFYDPSGLITDAETGQPIEGASVSLYRVPNAIPDKDGQTHDCRTVDTRPPSSGGIYGNWSGLPAASVDAGIWLNPELGIINGTQEISPTINPQITGKDGRYGWDVVEGCWYVVVGTQGYSTIVSPLVGVPPEVTDLDIALSPLHLVYLPIIIK